MARITSYVNYLLSEARTSFNAGPTLPIPSFTKAYLIVYVSAVSGTLPSLSFSLRATNVPKDIETTPSITATGYYVFSFSLPPYSWWICHHISGTNPSFTFLTNLLLEGEDTPYFSLHFTK